MTNHPRSSDQKVQACVSGHVGGGIVHVKVVPPLIPRPLPPQRSSESSSNLDE